MVDDARGHIATVKMLRSFHYTDEKGKDQGINGEFMLVNQTVVDLSSLTPLRHRSSKSCQGNRGTIE